MFNGINTALTHNNGVGGGGRNSCLLHSTGGSVSWRKAPREVELRKGARGYALNKKSWMMGGWEVLMSFSARGVGKATTEGGGRTIKGGYFYPLRGQRLKRRVKFRRFKGPHEREV